MYRLAVPRHDGPLRRRWRDRRWPRRPDLSDRLGSGVTRSDVSPGPDWLGILYAEQLCRELEWADGHLSQSGASPSSAQPG